MQSTPLVEPSWRLEEASVGEGGEGEGYEGRGAREGREPLGKSSYAAVALLQSSNSGTYPTRFSRILVVVFRRKGKRVSSAREGEG